MTIQTLLQQLGITQGDAILDIGFRDVAELQTLADLAGAKGRVIGIDLSAGVIKKANQTLSERPVPNNIEVKYGSILDIPAQDDMFDLVFCKGVLHEIRQLDQAMQEMARVCKPAGLIAIIDLQSISRLQFEWYQLKAIVKFRRFSGDVHPGFKSERLQALLARHRLEEVEYHPLSTIWRLGTIQANTFLLKARLRE